jgi:polyisoprenoid-binding protein YceI
VGRAGRVTYRICVPALSRAAAAAGEHALMTTATSTFAPGTYRIDPSRSTVTFAIKELGLVTVRGSLAVHAGTVVVAEDRRRSSATATIDVNGIRTGNDRRDKDLRAARFLDTGTYPTMTFESTAFGPRAGSATGGWELAGTLVVRGTAGPVAVAVTEEADGTLRGTARVDRYAFGVTAGKGIIARYVDVTVEIVLSR